MLANFQCWFGICFEIYKFSGIILNNEDIGIGIGIIIHDSALRYLVLRTLIFHMYQ